MTNSLEQCPHCANNLEIYNHETDQCSECKRTSGQDRVTEEQLPKYKIIQEFQKFMEKHNIYTLTISRSPSKYSININNCSEDGEDECFINALNDALDISNWERDYPGREE